MQTLDRAQTSSILDSDENNNDSQQSSSLNEVLVEVGSRRLKIKRISAWHDVTFLKLIQQGLMLISALTLTLNIVRFPIFITMTALKIRAGSTPKKRFLGCNIAELKSGYSSFFSHVDVGQKWHGNPKESYGTI